MSTEDIYNFIRVNDRIFTSGQPAPEQIESLAAEGFSTVINLAAGDGNFTTADEAELIRSLGMTYYHIPVEWDNPTEADFAEFEKTMLKLPEGKTLIHCAANFRVTAFYSLYAQKHLGWSSSEAVKFREAIWKGSDYPVWQEFIARIETQIDGH